MKIHILRPMTYKAGLLLSGKKQLRLVAVLFCIFASCILSGCAAEDFVLQCSKAMSDADLQKYDKLKNSNQLDESHCYISSEMEDASALPPPETASI